MKRAILYVHGKGGSAGEADRFRAVCPSFDVLGVDYRGELPWEAAPQIAAAYDEARRQYEHIILLANSIGAYFTMLALGDQAPDRALFVSPVLDMERLILDMMAWAGVSEQALCERGEVPTDFGETLSWAYLCYVREHPIAWQVPTEILYAGATIWCPVRVWSSSRRSTAPVSPSWRAVSTGSTQRNRWPYWIAG
ncbi:alpha/beta hydrolase [Flavonifractor sp. An9]|uniref:alpha/beta hydrolase n=1 Tax=Flavonifractor sp. An9 TaxID=1965664 RepID=UPI0026A54CA3